MLLFLNAARAQNIFFQDVTDFARVAMPTDPNGFGHGVAIADFNGDSRPDIYLVSYDTGNSLFLNDGNGRFTDVAENAGVFEGSRYDRGVAAADYDNDGDVDLYIASGAASPHLLYRNNGDGNFLEVGSQAGLRLQGFQGQGVSWGDYDNDGLLDLFLPSFEHTSRLYRQDRNHRFHEVSHEAGIIPTDNAVQSVFFDVDLDRDLDLFVSRGSGFANRMFINQGNGRFQDEASTLHLADPEPHGQGVAVADYDNDGDFDLYMSNSNGPNRLYRNDGDRFREAASAAGVRDESRSLGCTFADFDNDGWVDLYVGNFGPNRMYRNRGNGTFANVSAASGTDHSDRAYGTGVTDYDGDGALDIFFSNSGQPSVLLHNESATRHWLKIVLAGKESNRNGIGAIVRVDDGERKQVQQFIAGYSMVSGGGDLTFHFGLGASMTAKRLEVLWPSGKKDVVLNVEANRTVRIAEGSLGEPVIDSVPPQISNVNALVKSDSSVLITWSTDEAATSQVEYGATATYGDTTSASRALVTRHAVMLHGLQANAVYHYRVHAQDSARNRATSNGFVFTVAPVTLPPLTQKARAQNITSTSAEVIWQTSAFATAWLEYGADSSMSEHALATTTNGRAHLVALANLTPNTVYYGRAFSRLSSHGLIASPVFSFTTLPDSNALPTIFGIRIEPITSAVATITWKTDVPSDAQIEYGLEEAYDKLSPRRTALATEHSFTLQNLAANRLYRFRARSKQRHSAIAKSLAQQFITLPNNGDLARNVELLGFLPLSGHPTVGDVWGYANETNEYALVCLRYNGLAIVDVTEPRKPVRVATVTSFNKDLHTVKIYRHYALAVNEYGPMEIIDLADPRNPEIVALYNSSFIGAHNVFVDEHYAYVVGTHPIDQPDDDEHSGLHIIDLTDPTQPRLAGKREGFYIHDLFVQNDTAYVGGYRSNQVRIWSVKDKGDIRDLVAFAFRYPHTVRRGGNASILILNDEGQGRAVEFWDIHDHQNIRQAGSYMTDPLISPHNVEPIGNLAFIAYFEDMLRIVDYNDPVNPVEVGFYDTYPQNPSHGQPRGAHQTAAWGVYPHPPSGNIYISDMTKGLYVFRYAPAGPAPSSTKPARREVEVVDAKSTEKNNSALETPRSFSLSNYPNPFRASASTTIHFELPREAEVELTVLDLNGRVVRNLTHTNFSAGSHQLTWRGEADNGGRITAGIYFMRMRYRIHKTSACGAAARRVLVLP